MKGINVKLWNMKKSTGLLVSTHVWLINALELDAQKKKIEDDAGTMTFYAHKMNDFFSLEMILLRQMWICSSSNTLI